MIRIGIGIPSSARRRASDYLVGGDFSSESVGALSDSLGLTFARASTGSTYDEAALSVTLGLGVDVGRVAKTSAGNKGLLIEPARTNLVVNARDLSQASWSKLSHTITSNAANGPDGTLAADRAQIGSGGYCREAAAVVSGSPYAASAWLRSPSGSKTTQLGTGWIGVSFTQCAIVDTEWRHFHVIHTEAQVSKGIYVSDGRDWSGSGGLTAGARDDLVDLAQLERGRFVSSAIPTSGASASRAADQLSVATATANAGGELRFYCKFTALAASTSYVEPGASSTELHLWVDSGGSYRCWIDSGYVFVQGYASDLGTIAAVYSSSTLTWADGDVVEIWVTTGGGSASPTIAWRVNAGAVTTPALSHPSRYLTLPTIGATLYVTADSAGAQGLPGVYHQLGFLRAGRTPDGF